MSQRAGEIYDSFLSSKATTPVNIDSQAQLADDVLTSPRPDMFKTQQLQVRTAKARRRGYRPSTAPFPPPPFPPPLAAILVAKRKRLIGGN